MLDVTSLSLDVSTIANFLKLARHLLHVLSENGQLASNVRYVLFGCHVCQILRAWEYLDARRAGVRPRPVSARTTLKSSGETPPAARSRACASPTPVSSQRDGTGTAARLPALRRADATRHEEQPKTRRETWRARRADGDEQTSENLGLPPLRHPAASRRAVAVRRSRPSPKTRGSSCPRYGAAPCPRAGQAYGSALGCTSERRVRRRCADRCTQAGSRIAYRQDCGGETKDSRENSTPRGELARTDQSGSAYPSPTGLLGNSNSHSRPRFCNRHRVRMPRWSERVTRPEKRRGRAPPQKLPLLQPLPMSQEGGVSVSSLDVPAPRFGQTRSWSRAE